MKGHYNKGSPPRLFIIPLRTLLMRESILAEQTRHFVRSQQWQAAVLPFGAIEPHNMHMPYGTDVFQVEKLGEMACQRPGTPGRVLYCPRCPTA